MENWNGKLKIENGKLEWKNGKWKIGMEKWKMELKLEICGESETWS